MVVISPVECIHCGRCVPECPGEAVFSDTKPDKFPLTSPANSRLIQLVRMIQRNARPMGMATAPGWISTYASLAADQPG